jgi:hypothetical protein
MLIVMRNWDWFGLAWWRKGSKHLIGVEWTMLNTERSSCSKTLHGMEAERWGTAFQRIRVGVCTIVENE